ncbi:MAG: hypothetical protein Hyperionvirus11_6 [Hyperionvirus sp.]|uniref:Leucine-rich repeat protein n=1 Tax=Hyperionvirus sp. TaxID=2487770 RepID=A0A3G5ACX4_9VIRU|nr:MAG: hypothetical protein Hyperionvirus11_6 [Hyperionvirus sp.]
MAKYHRFYNVPPHHLCPFMDISDVKNMNRVNKYLKKTMHDISQPSVEITDPRAGSSYMRMFRSVKLIVDVEKMTQINDTVLNRLHNITSLDVHDKQKKISNKGLSTLINLENLDIRYSETITDDGLTNLSRLKTLRILSGVPNITGAGLLNLISLTELDISGVRVITRKRITDAEIKHLSRLIKLKIHTLSPITHHGLLNLRNLRHLKISGIHTPRDTFREAKSLTRNITDDGLGLLTNLQGLELYTISDEHYLTHLSISKLINLTELKIYTDIEITKYGLLPLTKLQLVSLTNTCIGDNFMDHLTDLKELKLSNNRLLSNLDSPGVTSIRILELENQKITPTHINNLSNLLELSIKNNHEIKDDDLIKLKYLKKLHLDNTTVTGKCFEFFENLISLEVIQQQLGDNVLRSLTKLERISLDDMVTLVDEDIAQLVNLRHGEFVAMNQLSINAFVGLRKLEKIILDNMNHIIDFDMLLPGVKIIYT